jgi:hypothetical protein
MGQHYICDYFASTIRVFLIEKGLVLLYMQDKNRPIKYIILEFNALCGSAICSIFQHYYFRIMQKVQQKCSFSEK